MAIAYRSSTSVEHTDIDELMPLAKPAGLADGDVLVMLVGVHDGGSGSTVTWPSGFVQHRRTTGPHSTIAVATKVVTNAAGEPSTYLVNWSVYNAVIAGTLAAYSGVSPTNPVVDTDTRFETSQSTSSTQLDDIAVTEGSVAVGYAYSPHGSSPSYSTPSGYTERRDQDRQQLTDRTYATAGFTGNKSLTGSSTGWLGTMHTALRSDNAAPNAPTLDYPTGGVSIDRTQTHRFDWTFSDPNPGDTQSAFELRYKLTSSGTWTTIAQSTANTHHDIPAFTFAAGNWEWQVKTTDNNGNTGPFSASSLFTATTPAPDGPTILEPVSGSFVTVTAPVTWSVTSQQSYQVRTVNDVSGAPGSTVFSDTGEVTQPSVRSITQSFPVDGRTEHVQVRIKENDVFSAYVSARVVVTHVPPPAPTMTFTVQEDLGAIDIEITNPAPTGGQPDAIFNEVWIDDGGEDGLTRRQAALFPNTTFRHWTAVSGHEYDTTTVRIRAVSATGLSTWSE